MQLIEVDCPKCGGRFYVGPEYRGNSEAPCHCPYCETPFRFAEGLARRQSAPPLGGERSAGPHV